MALKAKTGIKKKFFEVKMQLTASKVSLYGSSEEQFENSVVKIDLTKNLRGKSLELRSRVMRTPEGLVGEPLSLELMPSYIRRMIRKGSDYVEDSFEIQCKDAILRVKPFMLTRKKVSRAVRRELRETTKKYLENYIKIRTINEIFSEIMTNKVQKELFLKLKKIYPLSLCEIRIVEVTSRDVPEVKESSEEPAAKPKKKAVKKDDQ